MLKKLKEGDVGAFKYAVILESDTPPNLMLGQIIGGAVVKEMKTMDVELVSASQLAEKYNMSVPAIRQKLASINQGTVGKCLYNPYLAHELLTAKAKKGRPRAN